MSLDLSNLSSLKSTLISGLNEEMPNSCVRLFYRITSENNILIICLKIYINELNRIFITQPNMIFLLYDKTSELSFEKLSEYYENLIKNKKYENTKFILVGNKKDLINEEIEEDENKKQEGNKEKQKDEIMDNQNNESRQSLLNLDEKINNYYKDKDIILKNEISGLTGEGVMQLLEESINILFNDIKSMEEDAKEFDVSLSFSQNIEKELNFSSSGQSYHSNEYKKEVNKINKKRRVFLCCHRCSII